MSPAPTGFTLIIRQQALVVMRSRRQDRRLALPGVGPFIAAGPIMASLAGLGVGGAVGGFVGALVGMGILEFEAKLYDVRVKDGGVQWPFTARALREFQRPETCSRRWAQRTIATCLDESLSSSL